MATTKCPVAECDTLILPERFMCTEHWKMIPDGLRDGLLYSFRAHGATSSEYKTVARVALNVVARALGHPEPEPFPVGAYFK